MLDRANVKNKAGKHYQSGLVLEFAPGEEVEVAGGVVKVLSVGTRNVRLGFDFPRAVTVSRPRDVRPVAAPGAEGAD